MGWPPRLLGLKRDELVMEDEEGEPLDEAEEELEAAECDDEVDEDEEKVEPARDA